MSGDPDQEFFSDGISEELLNVLAKVKGLRVTSRTSAFAFKGKNTSIPEIAEKLGVKHVLEGSVRMAGDRVRITTQLIEVETDSHLWSESYDRELSDIFAVQDEIAAKVGEALKVALLGADSKPIRPSGKTSIEVYSDYLLARQMLASFKIAEWGKAERLFKSVIERDPGYAPAYSALASLYYEMATAGVLSYSEASDRMTPAIEQALSLDPELAEAWQSLAWLRHADGDPEGARAAGEKALDLDPQNPFVLGQQITNWIYTHEPERGLAFADELLRVDPLSTVGLGVIAYLYQRLGRDNDAERIWERIYSIDPEDVFYWWNTSLDARNRGDLVRALRQMREYTTIDPDESEGPAIVAAYYFDLGDVVAAEFWKEASLQRDPEAPVGKRIAALLQLYHDDEAAALAIAREIIQPAARTRGALAAALRMLATSDLAEGNDRDAIDRYLAYYPELADAKFSLARAALEFNTPREFFYITVDLAAAYLHAGEQTKADQLLSWVESELPHWRRDTGWGSGFADVQLHALRGEKEKALAALQEHVEMGTRYMWRWHILYNPNLDSIRDAPEFSAAVAKIEADMAEQLARVRDMERNGELEPIPELATE
jgi:TolB-like protein/Flp pilus assembly protein TadD